MSNKNKTNTGQEFQDYLKALHEITIELTTIQSLDEFYKRAVEFGLQRLGFDRLGFILYDPEHDVALGTWGTDAKGNLVDEHHHRYDPAQLTGLLKRAMQREDRFAFNENVQLYDESQQIIGMGWNAVAVLWNGYDRLGWLATDNGVNHLPLRDVQLEILALYALTLGTLLAQKRVQIGLHEKAEQLRRSEQVFRFLVQGAKEYAIYLINLEGKIASWNSGAERITGYTMEEILGQPYSTFFTDEDKQAQKPQRLLKIAETEGHIHDQGWRIRKDGAHFWADVDLTALWNEDRSLYGFAKIVRDSTERKQTEETLEISAQMYRDLFLESERQVQDAALLEQVRMVLASELDLSNVFRTVVEAVAKTYGYTQVSLYKLEDDVSVLQHQVGYTSVLDRLPINTGVSGRVIRSGQPVLVEDVRTDPDFLAAVEGLVSEICVPLFDQDKVIGFFNIESIEGKQLTQADLNLMIALSHHINIAIERAGLYTELRKNEEWFRLLFDRAPIGMTVIGLDGRFHRVNQTYSALLNYTPDELREHNFQDLTHVDDLPQNLALLNQLLRGVIPDYQLEKRYITKSGKPITVIAQSSLLRDAQGSPSQLIEQVLDITERKFAEQQALDLVAEKQSVKILHDFIRDISHDFRTPLAVINTSAYMLTKSDNVIQRQEANRRIHDQVSHLTQMLEQILSMSQLDSVRAFPFETVSINQLLEEAILYHAPTIEDKHINVILKLDKTLPFVQADPIHLGQAISNLVENAVLYNLQDGTITVQSYLKDSSVVIDISDTGIGISEESLSHIFDRLYRVNQARTLQDGGAGLGLSIAKRIIELHDGQIEVESVVSKGTTFRVLLPLKLSS
jgi:PAS domain S-box-containing protein